MLNSLKNLDLSNNNIENIDPFAFGKKSQIEKLLLNHNKLQYFESMNFQPISSFLKELQLSHALKFNEPIRKNQRKFEDFLILSKLTKLETLILDHNKITFLSPNIFCNFESLKFISLSHNNIEIFNFTLDCLKHLERFDIVANNLKSFTVRSLKSWLHNWDHNVLIDLSGNYPVCDCGIYKFVKIIHNFKKNSIKIKNISELRCAFSYDRYSNYYIKNLKTYYFEDCYGNIRPDSHIPDTSTKISSEDSNCAQHDYKSMILYIIICGIFIFILLIVLFLIILYKFHQKSQKQNYRGLKKVNKKGISMDLITPLNLHTIDNVQESNV